MFNIQDFSVGMLLIARNIREVMLRERKIKSSLLSFSFLFATSFHLEEK